jgi:hypothetical protein
LSGSGGVLLGVTSEEAWMSATFIIALIVALLMVIYWRVTLVVLIALLLALIVTGVSAISGTLAVHEGPQTIIAPRTPATNIPDFSPGSADSGSGSEDDLRA